jgi:hypothetical protein
LAYFFCRRCGKDNFIGFGSILYGGCMRGLFIVVIGALTIAIPAAADTAIPLGNWNMAKELPAIIFCITEAPSMIVAFVAARQWQPMAGIIDSQRL